MFLVLVLLPMTPRFWHEKVRLRIQIKTDDVVYSGRLTEDSCRG